MAGSINFVEFKKQFKGIKEQIRNYETTTDYDEKMKIGSDLMNQKYENMKNNLQQIRLEHGRSLFEIPEASFMLEDNDNKIKLTQQQTFLKRFLSPRTGNTGLLLFHGTGMGKTCSSLQIAENFLNVMSKKILIICSDIIQQRFKDEIKGKDLGKGEMSVEVGFFFHNFLI